MAIELNDVLKYIWAIPVAWVGSMEWRLRDKIGSREFDALQKSMETRFDDLREYNEKQTKTILREIRKNGNGG